MKKPKYRRLLLLVIALMLAIAGVWLFVYGRAKQTREHRAVVSFATAKPVLEANAGELPPELKEPNEGKWKNWAQRQDNVVRTRLEQGALDSMINLLLFGTSFTTQPRVITMNDFGDPVVQARVADLVKALRNPANNERKCADLLRHVRAGTGASKYRKLAEAGGIFSDKRLAAAGVADPDEFNGIHTRAIRRER